MAAAVHDDHSWEPPLLSWKGLQWWSVGCRAPAICEIFVGLKTKKLGKLIPTNPHKKKGKRRKKRDGEDGIRSAQVAGGNGAFSSPSSASLQLPLPLSYRASDELAPKRHSSFEERCLSGGIINQLRRNSDAAIGNLRRNSDVSASNLRRNSDAASTCNLQRLSASTSPVSSSCGGYERVRVLEGENGGGVDHTLPREVKLGGRRADEYSGRLGRQDSGVSAQRRSFCSSFSSYSSAAAACAGKVTSRGGGRSGGEREQRHQNLRQLVVGNQFLTHLTAAPLASKCQVIPHMRPSDGLLLDATLRCREEELKDRIIFFV